MKKGALSCQSGIFATCQRGGYFCCFAKRLSSKKRKGRPLFEKRGFWGVLLFVVRGAVWGEMFAYVLVVRVLFVFSKGGCFFVCGRSWVKCFCLVFREVCAQGKVFLMFGGTGFFLTGFSQGNVGGKGGLDVFYMVCEVFSPSWGGTP